MNQYFDFADWHWWVGVVFVGILVSVVANLLNKPIDKFLSSISNSYKSRSEAKKRAWELEVEKASKVPHAPIILYITYVVQRLYGVVVLSAAAIGVMLMSDATQRSLLTLLLIGFFGCVGIISI